MLVLYSNLLLNMGLDSNCSGFLGVDRNLDPEMIVIFACSSLRLISLGVEYSQYFYSCWVQLFKDFPRRINNIRPQQSWHVNSAFLFETPFSSSSIRRKLLRRHISGLNRLLINSWISFWDWHSVRARQLTGLHYISV